MDSLKTDTLKTVHDAVQNAAIEANPETPALRPRTFKVEDDIYETASYICQKNGTKLSKFLRECCHALVNDYTANPR